MLVYIARIFNVDPVYYRRAGEKLLATRASQQQYGSALPLVILL